MTTPVAATRAIIRPTTTPMNIDRPRRPQGGKKGETHSAGRGGSFADPSDFKLD
jgi:hypothetical protein|uniref:Uncharacterized protein n=1 Tax=Picea glauca TaxID=3330 RepID=A0A117NHC5_PICGL|nr:hypothetical protein ABT39_MTgene5149 [Picea glauca]